MLALMHQDIYQEANTHANKKLGSCMTPDVLYQLDVAQ